ncbi:Transmembrane protease serine 11D [Entomophthora muscae]|uniref:Transmembrane protease serine 11D n=1 Tax=Entomophthora muscae TaxID=34485 RepID=A0ACC2SUT8_9FUNG|nr:Transmembrane protease serine 11D [Entomophthora muscae]
MKLSLFMMMTASILAEFQFARKKMVRKTRTGGEAAMAMTNHRILAAVIYQGKTICGGALYRDDIVLTTAMHVQRPKSLYKVKTFPTRGKGGKLVEAIFDIAGIKIHPSMVNDRHAKFNIAIIKLIRPESNPTGLTLDGEGISFSAETPVLIGWGVEEDTWGDIDELKAINLSIFPKEKCSKIHRDSIVSSQEFCAGHPEDNFDAYYLSQGSPLIQMENNTPILLGLFSWAENYDEEFYPPVFTRTSAFVDWIRRVVGN